MIELTYRRHDGSFVAQINGMPYHVVEGDEPLWSESVARADEMGDALGFEPPPDDPPTGFGPFSISDRQFAQQLAILGTISEAEALAWAARGDLPTAMERAIAELPNEQQFGARMLLSSATAYERSHPLVEQLGSLLGYDAGDIDDLWRAAARL